MRGRFKLLFPLFLLALGGCASVLDETTQVISVDTPGCPKAECTLTNDEGIYYIKSTPGTVTINKSFNDLTIVCKKGEERGTMVEVSSANGAVWGNIILGGGIGFLVDGSRGAGYDYSAYVNHPLSCDSPGPSKSATTGSPKSSSVAERLKQLNDLLKQKLISKQQYEQRHKEILKEL